MMKFDQWWLPDGETHLPAWMAKVAARVDGRLTYQRSKYEAALRHAGRRRVAVDVGAHVGLWSWQMARDFAEVVAFEPMPAHRDCWVANMAGFDHARLEPFALGAAAGAARIRCRTPGSSGDTGVEPSGDDGEPVAVRSLDSFALPAVDLLKVDCEGYELFVLQGAVDTLRRCRPAVIVEQKPKTGMEARYGIGPTEAVAFLKGLGYRLQGAISGDYILT